MPSRLYLNGHAFDFKFKISITFWTAPQKKNAHLKIFHLNKTVVVSSIYQKTAEKNGHLLEISYIIGLISGSLKVSKVYKICNDPHHNFV